MSKLIVEMEMPKNNCEMAVEIKGVGDWCPIMAEVCDYYSTKKMPDWCPIKGVLPEEHGDLIDRQDAIKEFEPYAEYESNRTNTEWVERIKAVLNAMTSVIAAERKDDELPC